MRLRTRRRALRRPVTFEPLENRCVLSSVSASVGSVEPFPQEGSVRAAVESTERFGKGVQLDKVRSLYGLTGRGQTIAVIDTGIAYDQRALGSGYGSAARVVGGWDVAEQDADPYDDGPAGFHGTHVAGIIAADDPLRPGVAPGVDLVTVRVFDDLGNGSLAWVEQALRWVADNRDAYRYPITAVNLSLGTSYNGTSPPDYAVLEDELRTLWDAGILVVAAAGNDFGRYGRPGLSYPAASPYVLPVGSLDATGRLSAFTQRLERMLAAPGENIVSTVPDHLLSRDRINDDWAAASGTSMAAPVVVGAAALVRQAMGIYGAPAVTPRAIADVLKQTATPVDDPLTDRTYRALDLAAAIGSLVPADDYGDSRGEAYDLELLDTDSTVAGLIATTADRDVFRFQVSAGGWVDAQWRDDPPDGLVWEIVGAARVLRNQKWVYQVEPGRDYFLEVGSRGRIGRYAVDLRWEAAEIDLGEVDQTTLQLGAAATTTFGWTAVRDGRLTLATSSDISTWQLVLSDGRVVRPARDYRFGGRRIDVNVRRGDRLALIVAPQSPFELTIANRVRLDDGTLVISGGNEATGTVVGLGTRITVSLDGVRYSWLSERIRAVRFEGVGGDDRLRVYGTRRSETVRVVEGRLEWSSAATKLTAIDAAILDLVSGGGEDDVLRIASGAGDDLFQIDPREVSLVGDGLELRGRTFDRVYLDGGEGLDRAEVVGSSGSDTFLSLADSARYFGKGFHFKFTRIEDLQIDSGGGSDDVARFFGSPRAESWSGGGGFAVWKSGALRRSVRDFDRVYVYDFGGADDQVALMGTDRGSVFRVGADRLEQRTGRFFTRIQQWRNARLVGSPDAWDEVRWIGGETPGRPDPGLQFEAIDRFFADWH